MNVKELLEFCTSKLKSKSIESCDLDALLIICHCLDISKEDIIFASSDSKVPLEKINQVQELIQRRSKKEPLSHILNKRYFYEDVFFVNKDVLDPRADSEVLIEAILDIFKNKDSNLKILELGVGSGCLLLSVIKQFENAQGLGVDISAKALKVANRNAVSLDISNRVNLIKSDWFSDLQDKDFDLIIANPPYIESNEIDSLQSEVSIFEPRIALDGGLTGLDCYRIIAGNISNFLKKDGYLFLEIGQNQQDEIIKIFELNNLKFADCRKDLGGIIRCLIFKK